MTLPKSLAAVLLLAFFCALSCKKVKWKLLIQLRCLCMTEDLALPALSTKHYKSPQMEATLLLKKTMKKAQGNCHVTCRTA